MLIILGLAAVVGGCAAAAVLLRSRRRARTFPPVVELAHTSTLPRLGFKIASLTAREIAAPEPAVAVPPPPALPFATMTQPVPRPDDRADDARTATPEARQDQVRGEEPDHPSRSVYEVKKSPYATPVVQGARITLPDDDQTDLPIRFRSEHPNARPIAEAGDHADQVQILGPTGQISVDRDAPIQFGPSAD